jgi:Family of unknown function (DUF6494)
MNEDVFNISLRKFLKKVGVTSQREIEKAVRGALDAGRLKGTETLRQPLPRLKSKVLFGELAKRVRHGAEDPQCDRSVSNRVPSEAIADGVDRAIGRRTCHTSFAARTALLIRKPERKLELQLWVLLEIRYGDRQKRDGLLIRMLREHRAHQFFCDLGKDCCCRNRRAERYGTADGAQVGEANSDRHRSAGPGPGPEPTANPVR